LLCIQGGLVKDYSHITWFHSNEANQNAQTGLFNAFYVGFGQAIAFFSANELLASLYVPFFFLFVVTPYAALPTFWRFWMYWLSPFHYLLEGFLAAVTDNVPAICDTNELARFSPPPGQT